MLTAHTTIQDAVNAMKLGACDFIINTVDLQGLDQTVDRGPLAMAHPAEGEFSMRSNVGLEQVCGGSWSRKRRGDSGRAGLGQANLGVT